MSQDILQAIKRHQAVKSAIAEKQKPKLQDSIIELLSLISPLSSEDKKLRMAKFKVDPTHATFETLQELLPIIHQFLSSRELANGKDGVTPVKGKDYFTDEDKQSLIAEMTKVPVKGKDYFTKQEIAQFLDQVRPIKGIHYNDGKNGEKGDTGKPGKDGRSIIGPKGESGRNGRDGNDAVMTGKDIVKALRQLKGREKLTIADVFNPNVIDQRWHGGGMSTGKLIIGEVVSGSGTSWSLAFVPTKFIALYGQGQRLSTNRNDFTISGGTITTTNPWAAGDLESDYYK